jgi:hypothetical protein
MLGEQIFTVREFFETRQGLVRLMPPLPQALAEMSPRLAKLVAPVVEQVAQLATWSLSPTMRGLTIDCVWCACMAGSFAMVDTVVDGQGGLVAQPG